MMPYLPLRQPVTVTSQEWGFTVFTKPRWVLWCLKVCVSCEQKLRGSLIFEELVYFNELNTFFPTQTKLIWRIFADADLTCDHQQRSTSGYRQKRILGLNIFTFGLHTDKSFFNPSYSAQVVIRVNYLVRFFFPWYPCILLPGVSNLSASWLIIWHWIWKKLQQTCLQALSPVWHFFK